ncbi:hypothetical protein AXE65_06630 [Ventosimonas gracilis]|uniref:Dienelactone hydrolase domain-containing protein n=1 Tax=Ventosimonas gracilis TaxID=1680762 RepID=A0A139SJT7_9GAMM|nr:alpha/beta hydrolase [Ventosimonas gracilis]KXU34829.1 hypothetical protein AXE65_06630 [Ventosimonas gracilis]
MKPFAATLGLLSSLAIISAEAADIKTYDNFYQSQQLSTEKVRFNNQYQMKVVGNLFMPKNLAKDKQYPAIIVGHPMGAVKEQSSNLYTQKLAEQGFITLAIDLSFWGESEGSPRNAVLPDMYTEDFNAAADFLSALPQVDRDKIGVLGICGSGGFAISAAKIDPRLKAIATVSMYDMGAVTRNGYNHSRTLEQRKAMTAQASKQRNLEFTSGEPIFLDYLPEKLPEDADTVTRMYHSFYRTARGAHIPEGSSLEQTQNRTLSGEIKFLNFYPFNDIESISPRPLLFIAGSSAHSKEFSEQAYQKASEPKELFWVKDANHVDLYDRADLIPFDKLTDFFQRNL